MVDTISALERCVAEIPRAIWEESKQRSRNGILSLEKKAWKETGREGNKRGEIKIVNEEDKENRKIKTNSGENVLEGREAGTSWQQP